MHCYYANVPGMVIRAVLIHISGIGSPKGESIRVYDAMNSAVVDKIIHGYTNAKRVFIGMHRYNFRVPYACPCL